MWNRRHPLLAGCGCVTLAGALFFLIISIAAAVDGAVKPEGFSALVVVLAVFALAGLLTMVLGLRRKRDVQATVSQAAQQAVATGAAQFQVPVAAQPGREVGQVRDAFRAVVGAIPDEADRRWDEATNLMVARRYVEALAAFQAFHAAHPERGPDALISIGACLHLLGRYEEAIAAYQEAGRRGADAATVAENIQESRAAQAGRGLR